MENNENIEWHDLQDWGVEGKAWDATECDYDRLPASAKERVTADVWSLSRYSTGMSSRFETDSPSIYARWTLRDAVLALPHMPSTSVSGMDLYAEDERGAWRWVGVAGVPGPESFPVVEARLAAEMAVTQRKYLLYLPLCNGVLKVEVGILAGSSFKPIKPRPQKPVVFYGTSIVQGIAASRSGMCHTSILGRRLDVPVINLGFSGRGRMEPEIAELLGSLDAVAYVIDCLPNMEALQVEERTENFLRILLAARPDTPIVLVEDRTYTNAWVVESYRARHKETRRIQREIYDRLLAEGFKQISYVEGDALIGDDDEACVDGSHPTDLGFMRIVDVLAPALSFLADRKPA